MSELIQKNDNRATIRWKLLTGVSALALAAYVSSANVVKAEDATRPPIWIELDGQFAQQKSDDEAFIPSFMLSSPFDGASQLGKNSPTIWDRGAKISFQPDGSDWIFTAGIRYGKSSRHAHLNQVTPYLSAGHPTRYCACQGTQYNAYQIVAIKNSESHTILDFEVGKDVGLGMFGSGSRSVISVGVRYAQFNSLSNSDVSSKPTNTRRAYYRYYDNSSMMRKFAGVGPALSWDASARIAGQSGSEIALDWGVNGAVLFGRQQARGHHQVTKVYRSYYSGPIDVVDQTHASPARSKRVTVPNLGGFASVSWRYADAKISIGYRADMFFGAMDGGIDASKSENRAFFGPFASISVGIGD